MSKLHVKQIEGYLSANAKGIINVADYDGHNDPAVVHKAFLSRGLAVLAVAGLTEAPMADLGQYVTDGQKDGGIDLIYFDPKDKTLYVVQSKWHDDGHGSIDQGNTLKFINGVRKVLDNDLEELNDRIKARKADIESAVYDAGARFVLVLVHTGQEGLPAESAAALDEYIKAQNDTSEIMRLEVLAQGEVHKTVATNLGGTPIGLDIQLMGWGQLKDPHFAIYGQVNATDVASWVTTYGNRLFERNLRQFLGGSTVNEDIVATLLERPSDFWYFNNGITAIASEIAKKPIGGNSPETGIFECKGFCIVNGAQTAGSVHAASLADANSVGKARLSVRIIASSEKDFSSEVTRYTNTQNSIEKRDFVALDPEQERIRQELHFEKVEYAYKGGSTPSTGGGRFDLAEATVALACANPDISLPVQAKREISKLWEDIGKTPYKQLFNGGVTGPMVWEAVQALRAVDSALTVERKRFAGRDALVCVHGNRFIQWATLRTLGVVPGFSYNAIAADIPDATKLTVDAVINVVKENFPE